jgi:hypothetical protein
MEQSHLHLPSIANLSKDHCFLCAGAVAGVVHIPSYFVLIDSLRGVRKARWVKR